MSPPWWAPFGPAEASVGCADGTHVIRWADGGLHALEHPDAEGELVMAALGGETSGCLDYLQAWGAHVDDLDALMIGPRSADDPVTLEAPEVLPWSSAAVYLRAGGFPVSAFYGYAPAHLPAWPRALMAARRRQQMIRHGHQVRGSRPMIAVRGGGFVFGGVARGGGPRGMRPNPERVRQGELAMLFSLGAPFQLRLSAAVAAAYSDGRPGRDRAAARPALTAALAGRLAPVLSAWTGIEPGRVEATVHEGDGWGTLTAAGDSGRRTVAAALPAAWLASVWAPGLALVDGHLVLAVREAAWPDAEVLALAEPGAEPTVLSVASRSGRWTAAPD